MPAAWKFFTICLNSRDLLAAVAGGGVRRVRGEEADRVVAPVVGQPVLREGRLGDELLDRQQLDRGDAEVAAGSR